VPLQELGLIRRQVGLPFARLRVLQKVAVADWPVCKGVFTPCLVSITASPPIHWLRIHSMRQSLKLLRHPRTNHSPSILEIQILTTASTCCQMTTFTSKVSGNTDVVSATCCETPHMRNSIYNRSHEIADRSFPPPEIPSAALTILRLLRRNNRLHPQDLKTS